MTATTISFTVDGDDLARFDDRYLSQLWHIAQANPAHFGDRDACMLAEQIGHEIVRRWLSEVPPELWNHQGAHINSRTNTGGV